MKHFCRDNDPRVIELRRRLDKFYATTKTYTAFLEPSSQPDFWGLIRREIDDRLAANRSCRILEFGAGRTGFRAFLGETSVPVEFHVQDVTPQNQSYLETQAQQVFICDVRQITGHYDVIFSTFVWEHVTNPRELLDHLLGLLNPGGVMAIASPRYDFPGYICPSARHYPLLKQLCLAAWLVSRRLRVVLGGSSDFLIHLDPAVFHGPWYRDADAIHWVSLADLRRYIGRRYELTSLRLPVSKAGSLRDRLVRWLWARRLVLFVRIRARGG